MSAEDREEAVTTPADDRERDRRRRTGTGSAPPAADLADLLFYVEEG